MNDKERIFCELDNGPWDVLYVLADLEEEAGEHQLADGLRWLATNKRWPVCMGGTSWIWVACLNRVNRGEVVMQHASHHLPLEVTQQTSPLPKTLSSSLYEAARIISELLGQPPHPEEGRPRTIDLSPRQDGNYHPSGVIQGLGIIFDNLQSGSGILTYGPVIRNE